MAYRVEPAVTSRVRRDFLDLPFILYRDDPLWVPPLRSEVDRTLDAKANPYFADGRLELFVCYRDDVPAARACAVVNHNHWLKFGDKAAFFGFFESCDDSETVGRLFDALASFCRANGATRLEGPFNPNHYSELGLQVSGFGRAPVFFETYNPEYYIRLVEGSGFRELRRVHTRVNANVGERVRRILGDGPPAQRHGEFRVRPARVLDLKQELERIRGVYNDAFDGNWHFLPLSRAEYSFAARYLFFVTCPRLVGIAERDGEPVGVVQFCLDVNPLLRAMGGSAGPVDYARFLWGRSRVRDVVMFAVGVKKAYRHTDVYRLLLEYGCRAIRNCRTMTTTWMTDDNPAPLAAARRLGLEPSKYFAIYEKSL
jgi:hypothetical protein